ncbi:uncharacterized protein LOC141643254 [Silene latifolia]|uniref:uncharacterized protein LOC141643254 n=1 Tax=Silene latifolia TaxID=37657 RepID=UPI003D780B12
MASETLDVTINEERGMKRRTSSSWTIISGSLNDAVTCESSEIAVDDSDRKSPLILRRPSPDSGPCEITILFTQQHEIKQVYIRSTSKVYEIYCATNEKSENEYLCTVRCGIAARDEVLQLEVDGVASISSNSEKSADEVHSRTDSGSSTDGDGWVDVKLNKSSRVDAEDGSSSKKEDNCIIQVIKDRFEATAEISDGDPVMSITLRLLSIQSGDYVYIDEVYVFADPVISADNHCSVPSMESSSGGAMLSMFMPTLLQLSKSRMSKVEEHSGSAAEERRIQDTEQHSTAAATTASTASNTVQTEVLPNTVNNGSFVHQPNHLSQTPNPENMQHCKDRASDFPCSKIGQTLDELVSRVSKIEDLFLRFEQNLLKPIINMETRLERVEQQLESFIKNPPIPRTGCTIYSAPEFSYNESESNSIGTGGNDCPLTQKYETSKKDDCFPPESCLPTSDACAESSTSAPKLLPGLIMSAPEFSYIEEDEEIDSMEAVKDSPKILKRPMSINDALASALAGFVTSTLTKPLERSDTVEEAETVIGAKSWSSSPSTSTIQLDCTEMVEEDENFSIIEGSPKTILSALVHSDEHQLSLNPIDGGDNCDKDEETTEVVDGNNHVVSDGVSRRPHSSTTDSIDETENNGSTAEIECTEGCVKDICSSPSVINSAPLKNVDICSGEGIPNAVLQEIIEMPSPGIVDFSVPMLDVKFSSLENSSAKCFLESLLVDMPALKGEVPCIREEGASCFNEQSDLIVVEDEESRVSESVVNKLLYAEDDSSVYRPSESERQDSSDCSNEGMCASLI